MPKLSSRDDLTDPKVKNLKAGLVRVEYPDTQVPGLRVVVQPTGSKVWALRTRVSGKLEKVTLGSVAKLTVEDAREAAREAIRKRRPKADGDAAPEAQAAPALPVAPPLAASPVLDVATLIAQLQALVPGAATAIAALIPSEAPPTVPEIATDGPTVGECWTAYLADDETKKLRTLARRKKWADKFILPIWRDRPIKSITQQGDVKPVVAAAKVRGPAARIEAIAFLSAFFGWCKLADQAYITISPADGFQKGKATERERALSEPEIRTFWDGCTTYAAKEDFGRVFGPYCKMLLLTGARRSEVSGMRFDEIDFAERVWTIPGSRTKNSLPLAVYLTDAMLDVLSAVPKIKGSPFVFTTDGEAPISGYSKGKIDLDALTPLPDWTLHDLRRTFVSGCNSLRVIKGEVVEKCVNHISGKFAGVAGTYNVFEYWKEKSEAWTLWSDRVAELVRSKETADAA